MSLLLDTLALARGATEEGHGWVGRREKPRPAPRRVGPSQVELFAALVRDDDPRYWQGDPRPVPPGLLMSYALPLPWSPDDRPARRPLWARIPLPGDTLINVTTSTVFHCGLSTDDEVSFGEEVVDVSGPKQTRVGTGHFLTTRAHYLVNGRPLADHTNVMIRYGTDSPRRERPDGPFQPPEPDLSVAVTHELCVHNVAATGDFFPGHYDRDYARSQGVPDTYLNTMFFHGLVDQLARHRRPRARLARRDLAMLASAHIGDTLSATATDGDDGDAGAGGRVDVVAWTRRGPCARGQVWFEGEAS